MSQFEFEADPLAFEIADDEIEEYERGHEDELSALFWAIKYIEYIKAKYPDDPWAATDAIKNLTKPVKEKRFTYWPFRREAQGFMVKHKFVNF